MLVDFYASLFFAEISKIHPEVFCTKFNLCEEMVSVNLPKNDDSWLSCSLCHDVVANVLVKLKDPDIQVNDHFLCQFCCSNFIRLSISVYHIHNIREETVVIFMNTLTSISSRRIFY